MPNTYYIYATMKFPAVVECGVLVSRPKFYCMILITLESQKAPLHWASCVCTDASNKDRRFSCNFTGRWSAKRVMLYARGVQRHPRRRKMRHRNPWGTKIRKLGGTNLPFCF